MIFFDQSEKQNENDEKKSVVNFVLPAHFRYDFLKSLLDTGLEIVANKVNWFKSLCCFNDLMV